jgi:hypothetical protein
MLKRMARMALCLAGGYAIILLITLVFAGLSLEKEVAIVTSNPAIVIIGGLTGASFILTLANK